MLPADQSTKPAQISIGAYERRETVEAFQFTEDVAKAVLIDKLQLPWGLSVSGSWHQERGEVHYASVYVPQPKWSTRNGETAHYGDWICKIAGQLLVIDNDSFNARYRTTAPDLLDALKGIRSLACYGLDWLEERDSPTLDTAGRALQALDAAIAKAEGRS